MPYDTISTWNPLPPVEEQYQFQEKADEMAALGLTDGTSQVSAPNGPGIPPVIVTRTWTTIEAAQEWKTYCETATPVAAESVVIPV